MSNLWHWCLDNKALLGSLAAFALSEALPFTSGKWNGLLQGLLTLLQKKAPPAPPAAN